MPKEKYLIKTSAINDYANDTVKLRITKKSVTDVRNRFDKAVKKTLSEAGKLAKKDKRTTIMPRDTKTALDNALGKQRLSADEIFQAIKRLSTPEITVLTQHMNEYIKQEKAKQK